MAIDTAHSLAGYRSFCVVASFKSAHLPGPMLQCSKKRYTVTVVPLGGPHYDIINNVPCTW